MGGVGGVSCVIDSMLLCMEVCSVMLFMCSLYLVFLVVFGWNVVCSVMVRELGVMMLFFFGFFIV